MSSYMRDVLLWIVVISLLALMTVQRGHAHDHDPSHDAWYKSLRQPDSPLSCCGLADAYFCDDISVVDGKTFCAITDEQDDAQLGRPHIPLGTKIYIPNSKLKWEQDGQPTGNPTGHAIVFLSHNRDVFCFVQAGGV